MINFDSISPEELIIVSAVIVFLASENQDANQLNVLGNLVVSIGSLILTWAAKLQLNDTSQNNNNPINDNTINEMKMKIKCLQDKYETLEYILKYK